MVTYFYNKVIRFPKPEASGHIVAMILVVVVMVVVVVNLRHLVTLVKLSTGSLIAWLDSMQRSMLVFFRPSCKGHSVMVHDMELLK